MRMRLERGMLHKESCWMNSALLLKMHLLVSSLHWATCFTRHRQMASGESMNLIIYSSLSEILMWIPNPDETADVKYVSLNYLKEPLRKADASEESLQVSPWFRLVDNNFLFKWRDHVEKGTLLEATDHQLSKQGTICTSSPYAWPPFGMASLGPRAPSQNSFLLISKIIP